MNSRRHVALLVIALSASLLRCAKDPTGFYVTVTDSSRLVQFLQVRIIDPNVAQPATPPMAGEAMPWVLSSGMTTMPLTGISHTFVVTHTGRHPKITIEVMGFTRMPTPGNEPTVVAYDRATVSFVDDALLDVPMAMRLPCNLPPMGTVRVPCPNTQRCSAPAIANPLGVCEMSDVRNLQRHSW